jgi:transcriptional antiterminator
VSTHDELMQLRNLRMRKLGERPMSIKELEDLLEVTRQKIAEQLSMVGRSIQSIDPTLYDKERMLEQAVIDAHLDACDEEQA